MDDAWVVVNRQAVVDLLMMMIMMMIKMLFLIC